MEKEDVKIGQKVRISERGIYNWGDQSDGTEGTIIKINTTIGTALCCHVEWGNENVNDYAIEDLKCLKEL